MYCILCFTIDCHDCKITQQKKATAGRNKVTVNGENDPV